MRKIGSGILIDEFGRSLLIKRKYNKKNNPNYWAFPGGGNEENETMEETVIREVKEEVGLDFKPTKLFLENINGENHLFRFLGEYSGKIIIQEEECDGYGWFSYDEIKKLKISDNMKNLVEKLYNKGLIK